MHQAFTNFFAKRARYPRFKSKKRNPARFRIPQRVKIADGKVYVPKVGQVRIRQSRPVEEKTKSATFRRSADGKWYVTLTVEFEIAEIRQIAPDWVLARTNSAGRTKNNTTGAEGPEANQELFLFQKIGRAWKIARYCFCTTNPPRS